VVVGGRRGGLGEFCTTTGIEVANSPGELLTLLALKQQSGDLLASALVL
jgi:hypothetical protein